MAELFLELVSEEIPPSQQEMAATRLAALLSEALKAEGAAEVQLVEQFSTPLRFGVCLEGVPLERAALEEERRGPPETAPDKAIEGFKRSVGEAAAIEVRDGYFFAVIKSPAVNMRERLGALLPERLRSFPWQKSMRWIEGDSFRWVRPLTEITCLLDGEIVPFEVAKIKSSNRQQVKNFTAYKNKMTKKGISINPRNREKEIGRQIKNLIGEAFTLFYVEGIIKQMAALCEQPQIMKSELKFEEMELFVFSTIEAIEKSLFYKELTIPFRGEGELGSVKFVTLIHRNNHQKNAEQGIKRTLDARINDLRFFLSQDILKGLDSLRQELSGFTFHPKLGSLLDKTKRIETLCIEILSKDYDKDVKEAAHYCKADIASLTGKEFPEALGTIVNYFLSIKPFSTFSPEEAEGEDDVKQLFDRAVDVSEDDSILNYTETGTHYAPKGPDDELPRGKEQLISLADRADTLAGFFSIGEIPTGSKDPFALRRTAIGMIRIILESEDKFLRDHTDYVDFTALNLNLNKFFTTALALYDFPNKEATLKALHHFITERLKYHLRATYSPDLVDAAIKDDELNLKRIHNRVRALASFLKSEDGKSLMTAWKRISGILKDASTLPPFNPAALTEPAERELAEKLQAPDYALALASHDFSRAFTLLAQLRPTFDRFFEQVRVQTDDPDQTKNRLALCAAAREVMLRAADFSKIQG